MKALYFFCICISLCFLSCKNDKKLPVLGSPGHQIRDFKFTNQDGKLISNKDFDGKIYIADFFFTTCPTICPIMKKQMIRVQERFKNNKDVFYLSHTIDPAHDSVEVLHDYAERIGADTGQWMFVTGSREDIYSIANEDYNAVISKDSKSTVGFAHSGALVLIDKHRKVRGIYDGTNKKDVDLLMNDISLLLKEYDEQ